MRTRKPPASSAASSATSSAVSVAWKVTKMPSRTAVAAATQEARRVKRAKRTALRCDICGRLHARQATGAVMRAYGVFAICGSCRRGEPPPLMEPLTAPNALYELGEEPWEE